MSLKLMYITNNPSIALIAEKNGVDRIWVDLEKLGKDERQRNINSVKSNHLITDVAVLSKVLKKSELMVRVNPWNINSEKEIEQVIDFGAERIMLPMWKSREETDNFLNFIHGRVKTTLLLETKEAVECLDEVLENKYVDEIYIGLNDLHLSYGLTFMFEPLTNGLVEEICLKLRKKNIPYGFGGIARIGEGVLSSEKIIIEHYRLKSSMVILSRSFCNTEEIRDLMEIEKVFSENVCRLRKFEKSISDLNQEQFDLNRIAVKNCVSQIVEYINRKNIDD